MHAFCLFMVLNSAPHAVRLISALCTGIPMISTFQMTGHDRCGVKKMSFNSLWVSASRPPSLTDPLIKEKNHES